MSVGAGSSRRQVDRPQLLTPQRVFGAAHDVALERELRGLLRRFGQGQRLPPVGRFGLGLHDVERGERADFDARPVVFDELVGQLQRALGDVDRVPRKDADPSRRSARWPASA